MKAVKYYCVCLSPVSIFVVVPGPADVVLGRQWAMPHVRYPGNACMWWNVIMTFGLLLCERTGQDGVDLLKSCTRPPRMRRIE